MAFNRIGILLAPFLVACGPAEHTCSERSVATWEPSTVHFARPILCDEKLVGYDLDIDALSGPVIWGIANTEAIKINGPVSVSAEIDIAPQVSRTAEISRGGAIYDTGAGPGLTVQASSAGIVAGPLTRMFRVSVPMGTHYRGQWRNVKW